jgi:two-component system chemotaxis response regulator CheY
METRILIADDSPFLRNQLRGILEQNPGWQVFEAVDGLEAVQKCNEIHPDAVILDYSMPEMNGLAAAREINNADPAVPVVLFSVDTSPWLMDAARQHGAVGAFSKMEWRQLQAYLQRTLGSERVH